MRAHSSIVLPVIAAALFASASAAAAPSVALAPAQGPKRSGAEKIERIVRQRLQEEGVPIISERQLQSAAKKANADPLSAQAARTAGADLLVAVIVKKTAKKYSVEAKIIDVVAGSTVDTITKSYKKGGAAKAADALAGELVQAIASFKPGGGQDASAEAEPRPKKSKIVAPKDEDDDTEPVKTKSAQGASARHEPTKPKDEEADGVTATAVRPSTEGSGDQKVLQLGVAIGTQAGSAYTVTVGSQATGLAYSLNPLVMLAGRARLTLVDIGLGLELDLSFVPVKYHVDVNPMVTPNTPSGHFLDVGVTGFYEITAVRFGKSEDSRFYLAPLAGIAYSSLSVDNQMPYTVVVSSSAFAPALGGRLGLQLSQLTLEANVKADIIVSYGESPSGSTGQSGSGLGFEIGAAGRYWMSSMLGISFSLGYNFMKVGFSGMGTRTPFANDPALNNATVFSGNVKALAGVVLAI